MNIHILNVHNVLDLAILMKKSIEYITILLYNELFIGYLSY